MLLKAVNPFIVPLSPEGGGTLPSSSCHLLVMNFIRLLKKANNVFKICRSLCVAENSEPCPVLPSDFNAWLNWNVIDSKLNIAWPQSSTKQEQVVCIVKRECLSFPANLETVPPVSFLIHCSSIKCLLSTAQSTAQILLRSLNLGSIIFTCKKLLHCLYMKMDKCLPKCFN